MEQIEQLQQENAKLQERLNNAAKFFKEQKAQIESLTKENEELQSNIQSKDKAYEVLQNTYNEVLAENEELKANPKDDYVSPAKWNNLVIEKESLNDQLDDYKLKLQDADEFITKQKNDYENKITLLEEDNIKLSKDNDDFKKYIETLQEDINKLKENNDNFEKEYKSLEFINDDLNKQIDILESKVSDLLASDKEYKEACAKEKEENTALNTALGEAEEKYDKLMNQFEKCNKFISLIIKTAEEFNYINIQNINQKSPVNKNNTDNVFMKDAPEFSI